MIAGPPGDPPPETVTVVLLTVVGERNSTPLSRIPPGGTVGIVTVPRPENPTLTPVPRLWFATISALTLPEAGNVTASETLPLATRIGVDGSPSHRSSAV